MERTAADDHPELHHWRANTGDPVALDLAPAVAAPPAELDVLCWNVAIGKGRLLERLRALLLIREHASGQRPLVVLVQEAYRSDDTVPDVRATRHHGGQAPRNTREDIVATARELGLSLRYEPSMRNGSHRSDRGNAILSTVAIDESRPILLPYVRQRRAAVAARIGGDAFSMWVCTGHLDTRGTRQVHRIGRDGENMLNVSALNPLTFGAGRAVQAAALGEALLHIAGSDADVVLGADLNSYIGLRDPAVRALIERGFRHSERLGRWRHTFHGPVNLMLDHILFRACDRIRTVQVRRLDEGFDRSRRIFGSDHHPLLATVSLRTP